LAIVSLLISACAAPAASNTSAPSGSAPTAAAPASASGPIKVGLITKTETNPFFVKMKEGAQAKADELGMTLLTAAGKVDGDNESQVTAIENMVNAGVKGILITPSDTKAIVPAIKKACDAGVLVIALDTPTDPLEATDALFATDNFKAGVLIGQYAKAAMAGKTPKIATLDLLPGITVGILRHNGFMSGGNQQKVVLARWLNIGARVLLLDEPTRGIDVGSKAEIYHIMAQLAEQGAGLVMISSELRKCWA
jgi:fructose transport system substrate-binding protein